MEFLKIFNVLMKHFKKCGKLVLPLEFPIKFDEIFKITSGPSFIPNFNLLSSELDNFTFEVL